MFFLCLYFFYFLFFIFYLFIYFFFISNFLALIILQSETAKLSVTKSYILVDVVGVLQRGHKSDIMDFL